jgi:polyhydroxybutyrate depolymerase
MILRLIALLYLTLLSAHIGIAQQNIDATLTHNNILRTYRLYIPASYNPAQPPVPLIFNLHGYGSSNVQQELYGNFKPIADTANFILCHPNGTLDDTNTRFWNAGFGQTVDDIGFLNALADTISAHYNINPRRIYSTGMSNGGFMSHTLACESTNRFAAIASVTGSMTILQKATCNPTRPIPVLQIHGTSDPTVPYNGTSTFLPIETLVNDWVARNQCNSTPINTPIPDINTTDGCTAETFNYNTCADNTQVLFYKITNGAHTWPGSIITIGTTNKDFNASAEIWNFFRQYQLPQSVLATHQIPTTPLATLSPNPVANQLTLQLSQPNTQIRLFDLQGRTLYTTHTQTPTQLTIPTQSWQAGIYFVQVQTPTRTATYKIIK